LKRLAAARKAALPDQRPVVVLPDERRHVERRRLSLEHVEAASLSPALGARLAEARCERDCDAVFAAVNDLELAPLGDRALMDMPGEDELGAGVHKPREHTGPPRQRRLPGAPRRP
jgi:hypothetical protein